MKAANNEIGFSKHKNDDLDLILKRSETAKNLTEESMKKAKDAYDMAAKIVQTLENIEDVLQENKRKADEQLAIKAETKTNLESSNELSKKFGENLANTKKNLDDASRNAFNADTKLSYAKNVTVY